MNTCDKITLILKYLIVSSSAQAAVSIQFANLVREHQADARAWQERNAELATTLSEQAELHAKHLSDYEAEIARQHQEALSIIERQQKNIEEAHQQAAIISEQLVIASEQVISGIWSRLQLFLNS